MSYWDIRKRAKLNHLPQEDPEMVRAGVGDNDRRLRQSRRWLELYHDAKAQTEKVKHEESKEDGGGVSEHIDADGT